MQECPVCYEDRRLHRWNNPDCMHRFCSSCLDQWEERDGTCPLCRKPSLDLQEMFDNEQLVPAAQQHAQAPLRCLVGTVFHVLLKSLEFLQKCLHYFTIFTVYATTLICTAHFVCYSHLLPDVLNWNNIFIINMTIFKLSLNATGTICPCGWLAKL